MRFIAMVLAVLVAACISSCGGEDSPRFLNIDSEPEFDNDIDSEDVKGPDIDVDIDIDSEAEEDTDEDTEMSSDLAVAGMWRCLICDPGQTSEPGASATTLNE